MEVMVMLRRRNRRHEREQLVLSRRRLLRSLRDSSNPFAMSASVFIGKYRLTQEMSLSLIDNIKRFLTGGNKCFAIPAELKILSTLHFFAHGSDQKSFAGEYDTPMSQASLSRVIDEVTEALNRPEVLMKYLKFPNREERTQLIVKNYEKFGLPGVLGYVDSTHVLIRRPTVQQEIYLNRKFQHSINVQIACDSDLYILNILARCPGSSHHSFIWRNSSLRLKMQELYTDGEECWLLGDSSYPSECWLLTPILNAEEGSREAAYTTKHIKARNCIQRCIGVLKGRFRCISKKRTLEYSPLKAEKIINSCAVLHNMCISARLPLPANEEDEDDKESDGDDDPIFCDGPITSSNSLQQALQVRHNIIQGIS